MKSKLLRRGIEPIIAVVILVAVTLVIAIGVIGWIMGWWGTFGATENLQPYPDSYIECKQNSCTLYLHLKNTGSASAVIYKIEISGVETRSGATDTTALAGTFTYGTTSTQFSGDIPISPGVEGTLIISLKPAYTPGTNYLVKIYTRAGNVYSVTVQAK